MTKAEIREMMIKRISEEFHEIASEELESFITEDDVYQFLWERDFGRVKAEEAFEEMKEDYIEDYLEEIYSDIEMEDLEV